jgi:hypothetical protein
VIFYIHIRSTVELLKNFYLILKVEGAYYVVTCDYPIKGTKLLAGDIFQWQDSPLGKSSLYLIG